MKKMGCILALLIVSLTLWGCGSDAASQRGGGSGGPNGTQGSNTSDEAMRIEKYNVYVDLHNFAVGTFVLTMDSYFNAFETSTKEDFAEWQASQAAGEESTLDMYEDMGIVALGGYDRYYEGILTPVREMLNTQPDFGELDSKAGALAEIKNDILRIYYIDMRDYYASGEYLSDDYAGSDDFHAQLSELYSKFLVARDEFSSALRRYDNEQTDATLELLWEYGYEIRYYVLKIVTNAESTASVFFDIDIDEFEAFYDQHVSDFLALREIYTNEEKLEDEGFGLAQSTPLQLFVNRSRQMEVTARNILNVFRAGSYDIEMEIPTDMSGMTPPGEYDPVEYFFQLVDELIGYYNSTV